MEARPLMCSVRLRHSESARMSFPDMQDLHGPMTTCNYGSSAAVSNCAPMHAPHLPCRRARFSRDSARNNKPRNKDRSA